MGEKRGRAELVLLSPEEILAKQFRAKCRFKALVRKVIRNLYWLDDFDDLNLSDDVSKNIHLLTRKKSASTLTIKEKRILLKPVEWRTEAEKAHLYRTIGGLKCFRKYPAHVRTQLAAVTYFVYYGPGRIIYREGQPSTGLYFIVSGELILSSVVYDPVLQKEVKTEVGRRGPGAVLGEVTLLHNLPRSVTTTTNTDTELLRLDKDDFNIVLKGTVQEQWSEIQDAMSMFSYFQDWTARTRRECCIIAKMQTYRTDDTILGDGVGLKDYVYFIISGDCQIIQHLYSSRFTKNGKVCYKIHDTDKHDECIDTVGEIIEQERSSIKFKSEIDFEGLSTSKVDLPKSTIYIPSNVELHFMQVCILHPTACFAIGEDFEHRRIVALNDVKCLLIPRYWLNQRNVGNIWNRVKHYLNSHIPTSSQVQQEFLKARRWNDYKKTMMNELIAKKQSVNHASMSDVPLFIRMNEKII